MAWTQEQKDEVIAAYQAAEPTPETSMEVVKEIADEFDQSPNGVRMILTKAEVYVKKGPSPSKGANGKGGTRVSKADSQKALSDAIDAAGCSPDEEIITKLTGKAAVFFTDIINQINNG